MSKVDNYWRERGHFFNLGVFLLCAFSIVINTLACLMCPPVAVDMAGGAAEGAAG